MNDNQNPNVNNNGGTTVQTPNQNVTPNASQVTFTIGSEQVTTPSAPAATPMPASLPQTPVATPMPASQGMPVATPVTAPQQVVQTQSPVQATPVQAQTTSESPFFTPESVQPEMQVSPELPPITPASPAQPVATNQTPANAGQTTQAVQVDASSNNVQASDLEVIQTAPKSKASNVVLIIFLILLILFVMNIDTVITMYDQYKSGKNPIENPINNNTNNLTDGFILINENTSSIKQKDIKFYNFRQTQGKGITFSYEVLANIEDAKTLDIYVEIYNSDKEIIYKELFNPEQKLEKDTVRTYVMDVEEDIYSSAFYALVKSYTEEEKQKTSSLTCTFEDNNYSYKQTYNFVNNGLSSYNIEKTTKKVDEEDTKLLAEYDELKETHNATLEAGTLKYTVDLNQDNGDLVVLFDKDTTSRIINNKLTSKEWKCE